MKAAGIAQEFNKLLNVFLGFVDTSDVRKRCRNLIFTQQLCLALAKAHWAATATATTLHLAHEEHKDSENQQNRETGNQQLSPHRLLLRLLTLNHHIVGKEVIHQLRVLDHGSNGFKTRAISPLCRNRQSIDNHLGQTIVLNLLNKGRVTQLLFLSLGAEVVEYRQQYSRYR